ncbi:hypothetical protein Fot_35170 [Forsythia ovata]|uniref:Uncharacterized protein n=1 Tax=Forsythia ovata TaxID=205694 RepID=A0ABD1SNS7_9LAMI
MPSSSRPSVGENSDSKDYSDGPSGKRSKSSFPSSLPLRKLFANLMERLYESHLTSLPGFMAKSLAAVTSEVESLQKELFNFKESAEWRELYEDGKQAWGRKLLALIQDEHPDIKFDFLFEGNDAEPSEDAFSTASEPIEDVLPTDALSNPPSGTTLLLIPQPLMLLIRLLKVQAQIPQLLTIYKICKDL